LHLNFLPILIERLLYDIPYDVCLTAYYTVLNLWVFLLSKKLKLKPPSSKIVLVIMCMVLWIPNLALRITQQVLNNHKNYPLFNSIYLLYFSVLVAVLNVFYEYNGCLLLSRFHKLPPDSKAHQSNVKIQIYMMINGTLGLSIIFVGTIAFAVGYDLQSDATKWAIFEGIIHGCLLGAVCLEVVTVMVTAGSTSTEVINNATADTLTDDTLVGNVTNTIYSATDCSSLTEVTTEITVNEEESEVSNYESLRFRTDSSATLSDASRTISIVDETESLQEK